MKEKLRKIRDALENATVHIGYLAAGVEHDKKKAREALTLLDLVLAELDSPELITRLADAMVMRKAFKLSRDTARYTQAMHDASTAINTIKGEQP